MKDNKEIELGYNNLGEKGEGGNTLLPLLLLPLG